MNEKIIIHPYNLNKRRAYQTSFNGTGRFTSKSTANKRMISFFAGQNYSYSSTVSISAKESEEFKEVKGVMFVAGRNSYDVYPYLYQTDDKTVENLLTSLLPFQNQDRLELFKVPLSLSGIDNNVEIKESLALKYYTSLDCLSADIPEQVNWNTKINMYLSNPTTIELKLVELEKGNGKFKKISNSEFFLDSSIYALYTAEYEGEIYSRFRYDWFSRTNTWEKSASSISKYDDGKTFIKVEVLFS